MNKIGWLLLAALLLVVPVSAQEAPGYLRVAHFAADAPNVDVWLDGEMALEDVAPASISDFMEVEYGTHTLAIAPTGEEETIFEAEIEIEEEHYYSVAIVGQMADDSLSPLIIDETAAMEGVDMSQGVFRIIVNNIAGSPPVSFYEADMFVERNIEYGEASAEFFPAFVWDTGMAIVGEDLEDVFFDFDSEADQSAGFWEPYTVYLYGMMGTYPGEMFVDYGIEGGAHYVTAPDVPTFLEAFNAFDLTGDFRTYFHFETAVAALRAAGLDETLAEGGPYTLFIPVDQAFEALTEGALDALMEDPDALSDILEYHIVEGDYDYDALVEAGTVTSLQGEDITITPSEDDGFTFRLNDEAVINNFDYPFLNGQWRVWFINNTVLMPPTE